MNIAGVFLFVQVICLIQPLVAQPSTIEHRQVILLQAVPELVRVRSFCVGLDGSWYVVDTERQRIIRFDSAGHMLGQIGRLGWRDDEFDGLLDIHSADGLNFFAADANNRRLQRYGRRLELIASVRDVQFSSGSYDKSVVTLNLGRPVALVVTSLGDIFFIDDQVGDIVRINRQAKIDIRFGGVAVSAGRLRKPNRIAATKSLVAVTDESGTILYDYFGQFIRRIEHLHGRPVDVAIDRQNRVWILYAGVLECVDAHGGSAGVYTVEEKDVTALEVDQNIVLLANHPARMVIYSMTKP